jgi:hypothetical protein
MDSESIRRQAEAAKEKAEEAAQNSEYPRLGRAAYTGLSQALNALADTVEAPRTEPRDDNDYEQKRAGRIDRLKARAARLRVLAAEADCRSHDIGRVIPFGQPILVGHHSERGHRNAIRKMRSASDRALKLWALANRADASADAAENGRAISSDDPNATGKLREKMQAMERERDLMKAANKLAAKDDVEGLKALGFSDERIYRLLNPRESYQRKGFQSWEITNLSANIRRVRDRVAELEKNANKPAEARVELSGEGFRLFESVEDNRICFAFEGKPSEAIRRELKSRGFKWSPSRGLWVRQLNEAARWAARYAAEAIGGKRLDLHGDGIPF